MQDPLTDPGPQKRSPVQIYNQSKQVLSGLSDVLRDRTIPPSNRTALAAFIAYLAATDALVWLKAPLLVHFVVALIFCVFLINQSYRRSN